MSISSTDLAQRSREGDQHAATQLYDRYFQRLLELVSARLAGRFRSRFDAEDVCQSALRSMFRCVKERPYDFRGDGGVWSLLAEIALNKLHNRIRHEQAAKRNASRDRSQADEEAGDIETLPAFSPEPSGEDVLAFRETLQAVLRQLSRDERRLVVLQIRGGYTQEEISAKLGLSSRTIRRMPDRIRQKLADFLP